jgi:hypothetical protein
MSRTERIDEQGNFDMQAHDEHDSRLEEIDFSAFTVASILVYLLFCTLVEFRWYIVPAVVAFLLGLSIGLLF